MASVTLPARSPARATAQVHVLVPQDVDDDQLLEATADGDAFAFAQLYERVSRQVFGIVRRVLRDPAMSEEVAQEVLVEVWSKADHFDPDRGSASAWITTLAHRRAIDRVRSEQAARDREDRVGRREHHRPFDEVLEDVQTRLDHAAVRDAVAGLTARQREAVELAYFQGYTYREVATVLGIPEGTAKSRLRDALTNLREALQPPAA